MSGAPASAGRPRRIVAVGLGPFNLSLAALAAPLEGVEVTALEARPSFAWHPGMVLPGAQIQVPFLADLVTFADPTSPFSFLNYLKEHGRLHRFFIRGSWYPLRQEFSDYCAWVADRLPDVRWSTRVTQVHWDDAAEQFTVHADSPGGPVTVRADHVVVGTGTRPWLPAPLAALTEASEDGGLAPVLHTADYAHRRDDVAAAESVLVVGGGQSAAECALDLLRAPHPDLTWVTRPDRFFGMEVGQLTLELTSLDYERFFASLSAGRQAELNAAQHSLYRGISEYTIEDVYHALYEREVTGAPPARLWPGTEVVAAEATTEDGRRRVAVTLRDVESEGTRRVVVDRVVAGTGYRHPRHDFLDPVRHLLTDGPHGTTANADHAIDRAGRRIFVHNTAEQPLGLTGPDLGMAAERSGRILSTVLGREVYRQHESVVYQSFGAAAGGTA